MHDRRLVHLDQGFRSRWAVAQRAVWSLGVVVLSPFLDDDLGLPERVEDLPVEKLVAEPDIEALAVTIFPWAAWFDECGTCADGGDPFSDRFGDEPGTVVRSDECRYAAQNEQVRKRVDGGPTLLGRLRIL